MAFGLVHRLMSTWWWCLDSVHQVYQSDLNFHIGVSVLMTARDCYPRIPSLGIPVVFTNPESRNWRHLKLGILGLPEFVKVVFFPLLNNTNNNFGRLMWVRVLLLAVHWIWILIVWSISYTIFRVLLHLMNAISLVGY